MTELIYTLVERKVDGSRARARTQMILHRGCIEGRIVTHCSCESRANGAAGTISISHRIYACLDETIDFGFWPLLPLLLGCMYTQPERIINILTEASAELAAFAGESADFFVVGSRKLIRIDEAKM